MDDGWKPVEVEPELVVVNGNGTNGHHANRHDDIFGPTVELVPVNGYANGHHEEVEEPQGSLFSCAEFMAEQVKPQPRNHVHVRVGDGA